MRELVEFKAKYGLNEDKIDEFLTLLMLAESDESRQQAGWFSWLEEEELAEAIAKDDFEYCSGGLQEEQAYAALNLLRDMSDLGE